MNAQARSDLLSLMEISDWLYLRRQGGDLSLVWGFRGQTYQWDVSLSHEPDLHFCMQAIGRAAADATSQITWFHAALVTAWLRQAFYGGLGR